MNDRQLIIQYCIVGHYFPPVENEYHGYESKHNHTCYYKQSVIIKLCSEFDKQKQGCSFDILDNTTNSGFEFSEFLFTKFYIYFLDAQKSPNVLNKLCLKHT